MSEERDVYAWSTDSGNIEVSVPKDATVDDIDLFEEWVDLVIRRHRRLAEQKAKQ